MEGHIVSGYSWVYHDHTFDMDVFSLFIAFHSVQLQNIMSASWHKSNGFWRFTVHETLHKKLVPTHLLTAGITLLGLCASVDLLKRLNVDDVTGRVVVSWWWAYWRRYEGRDDKRKELCRSTSVSSSFLSAAVLLCHASLQCIHGDSHCWPCVWPQTRHRRHQQLSLGHYQVSLKVIHCF